MDGLQVATWGAGEPVVLVHGDVSGGEATWSRQRELSARFHLLVPDRRGFGASPPTAREDFAVDAADIADLLGPGAHLVGHSYGAVGALLAAARRPAAVRSLTVIEPPAYAVAADDPAVAQLAREQAELTRAAPTLGVAEFLRRFLVSVGSEADRLPEPLPAHLVQHARVLMGFRPPGEATIPLADLRAAGLTTLVVSGDHSPAFERICDVIAAGLGAERAIVAGAGHNVTRMSDELNPLLERFWRRAATG